VKGILMYTAQFMPLADALGLPLDKGLSHVTQGAGSLNAVGAVEMAGKIDTSAAVGTSWLTAPLSNQSTIGTYTFNWYQEVLWSNQERSGNDLMALRQQLFSDQVLWSDSVLWGSTVLWADNGVTADQSVWGSQCIWGEQVLWSDCSLWSSNLEGIEINGDPIQAQP
jgi:hypothetical protein